jgi:hypothetical protein
VDQQGLVQFQAREPFKDYMYQYTVYYDFQEEDGTWKYNAKYVTNFDTKASHKKAERELEYYLGSFIPFRINKVTCD